MINVLILIILIDLSLAFCYMFFELANNASRRTVKKIFLNIEKIIVFGMWLCILSAFIYGIYNLSIWWG